MAEKYTKGFYIGGEEYGIASALSATYDSNGNNIAETFTSLSGNVSANPESEATSTLSAIKVGDITYDIEGIAETYTSDVAVPIDIGGIKKGTTYADGISVVNLIDELLHPYIAFTFTVESTAAAGKDEYGTEKVISTITPTITAGTKAITGIVIKNGTTELYSSDSVESGVAIVLPDDKQISLDGTDNCTITVTITDGSTSASKDLKYTFVQSDYYTVSNSDTTTPTDGLKSNGSGGDTISVNDNQCIWYFSSTKPTTAKIQQFAMGEWHDMDGAHYVEDIEFTLSSGKTATYHAFVTNMLVNSSNKYRLA